MPETKIKSQKYATLFHDFKMFFYNHSFQMPKAYKQRLCCFCLRDVTSYC